MSAAPRMACTDRTPLMPRTARVARVTRVARVIMAIVLPRWSADCARREARRSGRRLPRSAATLVIGVERGMRVIVACCRNASRCGVRAGLSLAHARALCQEPRLEAPARPDHEAALLRACAIWCQRYAPITMIELAPGPSAILVDLSGCDRIYPCFVPLRQRVEGDLAHLGFSARTAIAPTAAAAVALAQDGATAAAVALAQDGATAAAVALAQDGATATAAAAQDGATTVARAQDGAATVALAQDGAADLARCSLYALRILPEAIDALALVNVHTIGELAALPRAGVAVRYGAPVLRRLDEALGAVTEILVPIRTTPPPSSERTFDGPVTNVEAIGLAVEGLVEDVCAQLRERDRGGREFELTAFCADAPTQVHRLTLGSAGARVKHLCRMLFPHLERMPMGMGVESLRLAVLRMGRIVASEDVSEWVDTLTARLGPRGVLRAGFIEDHRPARATAWISVARYGFAAKSALRDASVRAACAWRPSAVVEPPESVGVDAPRAPSIRWRGRTVEIASWSGPERIASAWDGGSADYWRLRTSSGRWLWLVHTREGWSLAGIWS